MSDATDTETLEMAGLALFGPRWQTDIARLLGLSDGRRVRQWMSGDRPIPKGIWKDLIAALDERKQDIDAAKGYVTVQALGLGA